jgi:hypothetical protein
MVEKMRQASFARLLGVDRAYITRLKQQGRIVLTEDGLVDVQASRQRILETSGGREDLAVRWAERQGRAPLMPTPTDAWEDDEVVISRADALARKEHYLALKAKLDYERAIAELIARDAVIAALDDLVVTVRTAFEQLPDRIAGQLVGKDMDAIRSELKQGVRAIIHDLGREAKRQHDELTRGDAA